MRAPKFTLEDIKFAEGEATFKRARNLYQSGKVKDISEHPFGYSATVKGTESRPYEVNVSLRRVDEGDCTCYLGRQDRLCKHILALALAVLTASGKAVMNNPEPPVPADLPEAKKRVTAGMQKLRPYTGPSRIWFSYQRNLATGAAMIAHAVSALPPTKENAAFLWKIIERIDKKLVNGMDDSDGAVGACAGRIIGQLADYARSAPELVPDIRRHAKTKTNFDFGEELLILIKE